ncbi:hypothetical protein Q8W71_24215 [Methylobacterium sp. NEAU 140]|uniref:hypothetical protein n=1 Tax=Methylobacterium sp. NEAU 140 TaxID=3064945 RepID=UPI0027351F4D|nr:hypothetical protein [Methylobacterium sp. NEAU 140]MDP4025741.1 hypothetical protein [Methylobacterium sp. NEAU 140]
MTSDDEAKGRTGIESAAKASLHTLDVRLAALKRLLDRRDSDGALVQADCALIEAAIEAARRDLGKRSVTAALRG